ncbi:MAG: helix-turn-helix domain-containing protein [Oscillospiraceae bacterium]
MGKKGTPHRKYSKEEKMRYVRLHLEDHISVRQIERDYGIGNALVSSWVKRYLQDGEDALEPHNGNPYAALHRSKSLSEVERLRLLVAKQEVEIARLKKGIGWKELVQTGNTLLAAERLRSSRRTQSKVSSRLSV